LPDVHGVFTGELVGKIMKTRRVLRYSVGLAAVSGAASVLLCACTPSPAPDSSTPTSHSRTVLTTGAFGPWIDGVVAVTYAPDKVPTGAKVSVQQVSTKSQVSVSLTVSGLLPNRSYGAEMHAKTCSKNAAAAGAITQAVNTSSSHRAKNILDFTTDTDGNASPSTTLNGAHSADMRSISIHESATTPANRQAASTHGLACVTLRAP
jgi:Cu-Zn family superoxide dismutase